MGALLTQISICALSPKAQSRRPAHGAVGRTDPSPTGKLDRCEIFIHIGGYREVSVSLVSHFVLPALSCMKLSFPSLIFVKEREKIVHGGKLFGISLYCISSVMLQMRSQIYNIAL